MPYTQTTLASFISDIGVLLDDTAGVYWTAPEITLALYEALLVFGAETNYWRTLGPFFFDPASPIPYYDLSVKLPTLRTRNWTLGQMVMDIQYMLLENPSGIAGTGMSGQISINDILNAIVDARNRFVLDAHLPLSVHEAYGSLNNNGLVTFSDTAVFVHRASWKDQLSTTWYNLWRSDEWSIDRSNPKWITEPGTPQVYSEASLAPLHLQLAPAPAASGSLEALTVDSLIVNTANDSSTFNVPDEWIHAVKYAALSQILGSDSQIYDPLRAQYAEERYKQAIDFAKDARSIIRLICSGAPLNIVPMQSVDAGLPSWRNQTPGPPSMAGTFYDIVVPIPGTPDQSYGVYADVVQTAPLPTSAQYIQMGEEDIDNLKKYVTHILLFKCGGNEFKESLSDYDVYQKNVAGRKGVNAAKIRYFAPMFNQPNQEWGARPDRIEVNS